MASSSPSRFARLALAVVLSCTVLPALATARIADGFTYTVCPSGCQFSNVQDAINAAETGDTISILAGTYTGQLVVPYSLTFTGAGVGNTILDGGLAGTVMTIYTGVNVVVSGITIQNGNSSSGGGVFNLGSLTLENSSVYSNTASSNTGGGIYSSGTLLIDNSTILSNTAPYQGGGVYSSGTMTVTNSTFEGNAASSPSSSSGTALGGGIYTSGTLYVDNSLLTNNSAVGGSGYIPYCDAGGAAMGGAIYSNSGAVTIVDSTVTVNSAIGGQGSSCGAGGSGMGGGIYSYGTLAVSTSTFSGDVATGGTGSNGYPGSFGEAGAIYTAGSSTFTTSTVDNNVATGNTGNAVSYGYGGGVYNTSTLAISATTISTNTVAGNYSLSGGGIYNSGALTLANSTLSGNAITGTSATAGGVYSAGTLTLTNSTISNNSVSGSNGDSGGGFVSTGTNAATLQNTILSRNIAPGGGPDCKGSVVSSGYNLVSNNSSCPGFGAPGDQVNVGAHLGPLQDNGGPTLTMAPQPGSPAIDAVAPSSCTLTTDQRAQPRPDEQSDNGFCDVGAVEVQEAGAATSTPTDTPTPTNTPLPPTDTPTNTPPPATNTPTSTPTPAALLGVSPTSGVVGQAITLSGANYGASETVNIYADSISPPSAYTATANISGTFTLKSTVKQGTHGVHTLIGVGQTSTRQASTLFTIKAGMSLKPASGAPGTTVTATDTGFGATETVTLHWRSATGTVLGTGTSNSLGKATVSFNVPSGSAAGRYRVYAIGSTTKAQAVATFTVT